MLKVVIKNLQSKIHLNSKRIKKIILKTLSSLEKSEKIKKNGEITICFVNDQKIKKLNLKYLNRNTPTDVLTFDISESPKSNIFADIVISTDTAVRNSRIFKTSNLYELYLYVIHGLLHLLGYDDKTPKEKQAMQKRAELILKSLRY